MRLSLLFALLLSWSGLSAAAPVPAAVIELLQQELQDLRLTEVAVKDLEISLSPDDPNYYQVIVASYVFQISADGSFAMRNNYLNDSLSEAEQRQVRRAALAALDSHSAIVYAPSNAPAYRLTVFTDATCPYCAGFHQQLPHLLAAGVEVRYLSFPRQGLDSPGHADNAAVWCSLNPARAMDASFDGVHVTARQCNDPVAAHYALAESFGLGGTPALVFEDGSVFLGAYDAVAILQYLRGERESLKEHP